MVILFVAFVKLKCENDFHEEDRANAQELAGGKRDQAKGYGQVVGGVAVYALPYRERQRIRYRNGPSSDGVDFWRVIVKISRTCSVLNIPEFSSNLLCESAEQTRLKRVKDETDETSICGDRNHVRASDGPDASGAGPCPTCGMHC